MTREEAILLLHDMKDTYDEIHENTNYEIGYEQMTALDMAIEALSVANLKEEFESADAVSREWYDDAVKANHELAFTDLPDIPRYYYEKVVGKMAHEINMLKEQLESADAVQGEWIEKYNGNGWNDFWDYTCSNCGKKYERADAVLYHANYCPNCGARMKGGAE